MKIHRPGTAIVLMDSDYGNIGDIEVYVCLEQIEERPGFNSDDVVRLLEAGKIERVPRLECYMTDEYPRNTIDC